MGQSNDEILLNLVMNMDKKIDDLSTGQSEINARVNDLDKQVTGLVHTVRGSNGTVGLVTQVAVIQTKLDSILEIKQAAPAMPVVNPSGDKDKVTWSYLVDKVILPVSVSALLWFLLTLLPKIIGSLNESGAM